MLTASQELTENATVQHDLPFVKTGARVYVGPLCTCTFILRIFFYTLEAHCPASFGDRVQAQESWHDRSSVGEVYKRHGEKKKESPKEPAVLDLGKANACSTRFGREVWIRWS